MSATEITNDFNATLIEYVNNMSKLFPNSLLSDNTDLVESMIKNYPNKIIDQFMLYVLRYKPEIDESNVDFLLNHDFNKETYGDDSIIGYIFEAKTIWNQLTKDQQEGTFLTLQVLCYYAEQLFIIKYDK